MGPVVRGSRLKLAGLLIGLLGCGDGSKPGSGPTTGGAGGSGAGAAGAAGSMAGAGGSAGSPGSPGVGGSGQDAGAGAVGDTVTGGPDSGAPNVDAEADSGTQGGGPDASPDTPPPPPPPWTELPGPAVNVQGGVATSIGGVGQPGGTVHLLSQQDVVLDPARAPAPNAVVPQLPGDAIPVTSTDLAANVTTPRSAEIADATTGGTESVRTVTANGGDLFIAGSLRAADLGAGRQGISLSAPGRAIFVTGTIDTSGAAGTGQAGGPITLSAARVVITGRLNSSGGDSATAGGAAGPINIVVTQTLSVTGGIDASGGNARDAGPVVGGKGGDLTVQAVSTVALAGQIRLRGGAATGLGADAQGGAAATLRIASDGAVQLGGIVDGRGGLATAATAGGRVAGGAPGALRIGEDSNAVPTSIAIASPINASGGDGNVTGGKGGVFQAEPDSGNVIVAGVRAIDVNGGSAMSSPGVGGQVSLAPRDFSGSGGVTVRGEISADGGSVLMGGSGAGAAAGRIDAQLVPLGGGIQVAASGKLSAVGGRSGGAARAGGGGRINLFTNDGDLTLAGTIAVRGGEAPDPGGTGGLGGLVYLWSDQNANANVVGSGNLLISPSGLIDASGGNGATGGSARNDGVSETVAGFPDTQEMIAILIDNDNVDGPTLTWLDNRGRLVARGGARNGSGGDIMFHGAMPDGEEPRPGNIDVAGDGSGAPGDFGSE